MTAWRATMEEGTVIVEHCIDEGKAQGDREQYAGTAAENKRHHTTWHTKH